MRGLLKRGLGDLNCSLSVWISSVASASAAWAAMESWFLSTSLSSAASRAAASAARLLSEHVNHATRSSLLSRSEVAAIASAASAA